MTDPGHFLFVGIRGAVIALNRLTGEEVWRCLLKGADFVNLTLDGDQLIATTKGEVFCLDALTGKIRWSNELPGMGRGVMTAVTALSPSASVAPAREKQRRDEEAASVAASTAVIAST